MEKQVRIITYCTWRSIGSILQAFALSATLRSCDYCNTVWLEAWNGEKKSRKPCGVKDFLKQSYLKLLDGRIEAGRKKRTQFVEKELAVSYFPDYDAFKAKAEQNRTDVFLAGSDQIWNPDSCKPLYLLKFADGMKRISYAASMGNTKISDKSSALFEEQLDKFEHISVRELDCAEALQPCTNKKIAVNIDPTFLLDVEEWRRYEKSYGVRKPYILAYMLYWNPACKKKLKALKRKTGLPVYAICSGISKVYADKCFYDVGVEEFLWLVDHAEYVVTSSFHGLALSAIFNKKVAAVMNPAAPSRIANLLNVLSIPHVDIAELSETKAFDYEVINARIASEKKRAVDYLKEAIG